MAAIAILVASAGPIVRAQAQNNDPVMEAARGAALEFTRSLPDYVVKRTTTRYRGPRPTTSLSAAAVARWRLIDVVTADVVAELGSEVFVNIKINGRPSNDVAKSGQWSAGEFSVTLKSILAPESAAQFTKPREATLLRRPAWRYDYVIDQPHSTWHLSAGGTRYAPAYGGEIWIDKATSRVLRIGMSARNVPASFEMDSVESTIDYDFVKIGDGQYLLPVHSEALDCERDRATCFKNVTDFRGYRKYSADANVTFE